jgi:manganese-dependent inorganic pyrophosphatase
MDQLLDNILIGDSVYIVGHIKPDVDAVVAVYGYQIYRHARGDFNYIGVRCDEASPVTKWLFKHFNTDLPMLVNDVSGRKIVLVDHTDPEQRPKGWENADIIEVLDHHKLKLETSVPPKITIRPYGSTSTLIAKKLLEANVKMKPELAGLLLGALLDDTLALRSPITTYTDKEVAGQLAAISGLNDIAKFAREMFAQKDIWKKMSGDTIITTDTKAYEMGNTRVQISQVETMDNQGLILKKGNEIMKSLSLLNKKEPKDLRIAMLTDLIRGDCIMIAVGDKRNELTKIFGYEFDNEEYLKLPGIVSRKKQVEAPLIQYFN